MSAKDLVVFRLGRGELRDFERAVEAQGFQFLPHTVVWMDTLMDGLGDEGDILWGAEIVPMEVPA